MSEEKLKHLEFIQNVITRMNSNSFQIKGWAVTLVSAILGIYIATNNDYFILLAVFPLVTSWFLDSYYLSQERRFRGLYNDVAGVTKEQTELKLFEMRSNLYSSCFYSQPRAFFSRTVWVLYAPIIVALVGMFFYIH